MKAISLWEPWATLVALGAKRIETRKWSTGYRGPLAIHAAKKVVPSFGAICHTEPFRSVLEKAGYDEMECFGFGKILAIADLSQVATTEEICNPGVDFPASFFDASCRDGEREFGNYGAGRFGWLLENVRKFPNPIPVVGRQRLWNWPVEWCDSCDGVGLMEGWNHRDDWPCPKCKGMAIVP